MNKEIIQEEFDNKLLEIASNLSNPKMAGKKASELREIFKEALKANQEDLTRNWNCQCEKPKLNGIYSVGEHEGGYQRCKRCDRRIWD